MFFSNMYSFHSFHMFFQQFPQIYWTVSTVTMLMERLCAHELHSDCPYPSRRRPSQSKAYVCVYLLHAYINWPTNIRRPTVKQ